MNLLPLVPEPGDQLVRPVIHKCQVGGDEVERLIRGNGALGEAKKFIVRRCIVSQRHPDTKLCIKSLSSTSYEIERHIRHFPYVVHPFSEFTTAWTIFMSFFTCQVLVVVPLLLAFHFGAESNWIYTLAINVVLFIDIGVGFFVGYFDPTTRAVILDRSVVVGKYLRTFFLLDFFSGFPFEVIYVVSGIFTHVEAHRWYWTAANVMKIARMRNLLVGVRKVCHMYGASFLKSKIVEMVITSALCLHWAACLEVYVPLVVGEVVELDGSSRQSWLSSEYVRTRDTIFKKYIASINRATIALMSSSHYLHVKTTEDIILNVILTILGRIGFIYILAQFLQLMTTFNSTRKRKVREMQQLREYAKYKELPRSIQNRLTSYYAYYQRNYDRNKVITSQVSPSLQQKLLLHNYKKMIETIEFLKQLPPPLLSRLLPLIKSDIYLPNDIVAKHGTPGDALYYISDGTVRVTGTNNEEICYLDNGSHFGEVSLIVENEKRQVTIVAMEICEFFVIKRSDFLAIVGPHANVLSRLQRLAIVKMDGNKRY